MFRKVQLPTRIPGCLYLHSLPGRNENWDAFAGEARRLGLGAIACLVPDRDVEEKSPAYAAALEAGNLPGEAARFPIPDFGVPSDAQMGEFRSFIAGLAARLRAGQAVLVHCGAGIGRTGLAAICLLLELGLPLERASERVEQAGSHPETAAQKEFVVRFAASRASGTPGGSGQAGPTPSG